MGLSGLCVACLQYHICMVVPLTTLPPIKSSCLICRCKFLLSLQNYGLFVALQANMIRPATLILVDAAFTVLHHCFLCNT